MIMHKSQKLLTFLKLSCQGHPVPVDGLDAMLCYNLKSLDDRLTILEELLEIFWCLLVSSQFMDVAAQCLEAESA